MLFSMGENVILVPSSRLNHLITTWSISTSNIRPNIKRMIVWELVQAGIPATLKGTCLACLDVSMGAIMSPYRAESVDSAPQKLVWWGLTSWLRGICALADPLGSGEVLAEVVGLDCWNTRNFADSSCCSRAAAPTVCHNNPDTY